MSRRRTPKPFLATAVATGAVLAVTTLFATACAAGNSPPHRPAASGAAGRAHTIAAEVPAAIRAKGTLTVAVDASYAPNEFISPDGHTVIGWDAELAAALGKALRLKVDMVNVTFNTIIPGLSSGRYDVGMSSFTDTRDREKTVDFVDYFQAGTSFFVKSGGGPDIVSLAGLCGHTVAVEKGTTEQADAQAQSARCESAGKRPVTVVAFKDQSSSDLALSSGRAEVSMADSPIAAYQVKLSEDTFTLSGPSYGVAPYGIAIPKNSGMLMPIFDALKQLMADGTYTRILQKWGVQQGAVTVPAINAAAG